MSLGPSDFSPAKGQIDLGLRLDPFVAGGGLGLDFNVLVARLTSTSSMAMAPGRFTAAGDAKGSILGRDVSSGRQVVSDKGIGASGEVCVLFVGCGQISVGYRWGSTTPDFGINLDELVTARAAASQVKVPAGQMMLVALAEGNGAPPEITLTSPSGRKHTVVKPGRGGWAAADPTHALSVVRLEAPEAGRWSVSSSGDVEVESVAKQTRVTTRLIRPATSRRKRLAKRVRHVRLAWTSAGLPPDARATLYVSKRRGQVGRAVTRNLPVVGKTRLRVKKLRRGANYLHLVVTSGGIPVDDVRFRRPVWR